MPDPNDSLWQLIRNGSSGLENGTLPESRQRATIREQLLALANGKVDDEFTLPLAKKLKEGLKRLNSLTVSQRRNIKRQALLTQVSGRNDSVFFATVGAFVLVPPFAILAIGVLTGYIELFPWTWGRIFFNMSSPDCHIGRRFWSALYIYIRCVRMSVCIVCGVSRFCVQGCKNLIWHRFSIRCIDGFDVNTTRKKYRVHINRNNNTGGVTSMEEKNMSYKFIRWSPAFSSVKCCIA